MSGWARVVLVLLGAAVLVVFVATADVADGLRNLAVADRGRLLIAVALVIVNLMVKTVRWRRMVWHFAAVRLGLFPAAAAVLAGVAAGSVSPARGVELAKPLLLRGTHAVAVASSTAAVLVERLMDGAALAVLCGFSLMILPVGAPLLVRLVVIATGALFVAGAAALLAPDALARASQRLVARVPLPAPRRKRIAQGVGRFAAGLRVWRHSGQLATLLLFSLLAALLEAIRVVIVFGALGISISPFEAMFAFGAANLVAIATLVPGGIGVTEASLAGIVGIFVPLAVARPAIAAAAVVDRVVSYYLPVVIGGVILLLAPSLLRRAQRGKPVTEPEPLRDD
ncbi:MAG TPA: lysylphosphatidylglycerol synthase transmembrane domain-containing protein [bacterium]